MSTVKEKISSGTFVSLNINRTPITMTLDTVASITIIPEKTYKNEMLQIHHHQSAMLLKTYTEESLKIYGEIEVAKC